MRYVTGNLLDAPTEALVNTVNTVGVMGKGIALQFKERFPQNFKVYADACKRGTFKIGQLLVVRESSINGEQLIINFPTKVEWFKKSQYSYIEEGLRELIKLIKEYNVKSIAIPPLGCGNGGLKWEKVKPIMESYLSELEGIDILVFQPNEEIKNLLQAESTRKTIELKPGRAMLLYALYQYERCGEEASVFAANKLAYFLHNSGEDLRLNFVPYAYGPYAQAVEKVLYSMNGKYLKGMEQMSAKPFEPLRLNWELYQEVKDYLDQTLNSQQQQRLKDLFKVIEGFESTLALEILASVHFLRSRNPGSSNEDIVQKIGSWNERKKTLITTDYVNIALQHLNDYGQQLHMS